jgi:hypothetical protein
MPPSLAIHRKPARPSTGTPPSAADTCPACDLRPAPGEVAVQLPSSRTRLIALPRLGRSIAASSFALTIRCSGSYIRHGLVCNAIDSKAGLLSGSDA